MLCTIPLRIAFSVDAARSSPTLGPLLRQCSGLRDDDVIGACRAAPRRVSVVRHSRLGLRRLRGGGRPPAAPLRLTSDAVLAALFLMHERARGAASPLAAHVAALPSSYDATVNDALKAAGWHLNALQRPPALHFCVTAACAGAVPALVTALREAVAATRAAAKTRGPAAPGAMAPVYGMAGGLPDRGAVGDMLLRIQDRLLDSA